MLSVNDFNQLEREAATAALYRCCGSARWAREMVAKRPFTSIKVLREEADKIWAGMREDDWLEAFAAHPEIGAREQEASASQHPTPAGDPRWSAQEQGGVASATTVTRERLARANREYYERFGFIFIVCATGKTAAELLAAIEDRLSSSRERELAVAAEEQRKITQLRLQKLIDVSSEPSVR